MVITGAGRAFCGGGDLRLLERMTGDTSLRAAIMEEAAAIVRGMTAVSVPIIAAVNGPAVGLGCSLAAMSDLVLVEEHAYFSDPHVALGLVAADGGAVLWPLLTGLLRAKEYILLGDRLPAEAAVQIGLANRVVPTGTSVDAALELAGAHRDPAAPGRLRDEGAAQPRGDERHRRPARACARERDRVLRRARLPSEPQGDAGGPIRSVATSPASSSSPSALAQIRVSCSTA